MRSPSVPALGLHTRSDNGGFHGTGRTLLDAVIVTYNSEPALNRLLSTPNLFSSFSRLIVVDNASRDNTCLRADEAGLEVCRLTSNVGFGAAANAGADLVRTDVFALLNPDIAFEDPTGPARLMRQFDDRQVAIVGPQLVLPSGEIQDSARSVPTLTDLLVRRFTGRDAGAIRPMIAQDVPWVVGGCMVIRKAAFTVVGGFDPRYFLYFEDVDICKRLRTSGWKVRFDPSVTALHDHAAESRGSLWSLATRRHARSAVRFYAANPSHAVMREKVRPLTVRSDERDARTYHTKPEAAEGEVSRTSRTGVR